MVSGTPNAPEPGQRVSLRARVVAGTISCLSIAILPIVAFAQSSSAPSASSVGEPTVDRTCQVTARLLVAEQVSSEDNVAAVVGEPVEASAAKVLGDSKMVAAGPVEGKPLKFMAKRSNLVASGFAQDLDDQLQNLPFDRYHPVDFEQQTVRVGEAARFELSGEKGEPQGLTVEVRKVLAGRVHLAVHWVDSRGVTLLQSKMRVPNGEKVVLGTDKVTHNPVVLCVHANCP